VGPPHRWIGVALTVALVCALVGPTVPVRAEDESPTLLLLGERGQASASARLEQAIRAQVIDLPVALQLAWIDGPPGAGLEAALAGAAAGAGARGAVWCDVEGLDVIAVWIDDGERARLIQRRVTGAGPSVEGRREVLALIVRTVAVALPRGAEAVGTALDRIEIVDLEPEGPAEEEAAAGTPRTRRGARFGIAAGVRVRGLGREAPAAPAVDLELGPGLGRQFQLVAGYSLHPLVRTDNGGAQLQLTVHDIRLGLALDGPAGRVLVGGAVAAEVGLLRWRVDALAPGVATAEGTVDVSLGVLLEGRLTIPIVRPLHAVLAGGAVIPVVRQAYEAQDAAGTRPLLESWPVQPFAGARLALRFD